MDISQLSSAQLSSAYSVTYIVRYINNKAQYHLNSRDSHIADKTDSSGPEQYIVNVLYSTLQ